MNKRTIIVQKQFFLAFSITFTDQSTQISINCFRNQLYFLNLELWWKITNFFKCWKISISETKIRRLICFNCNLHSNIIFKWLFPKLWCNNTNCIHLPITYWWLVRVTLVVDWQFLFQNFGQVVETYEGHLLFCECIWGGDGTWRWWGHLNTTCHNGSCLNFLHWEAMGNEKLVYIVLAFMLDLAFTWGLAFMQGLVYALT